MGVSWLDRLEGTRAVDAIFFSRTYIWGVYLKRCIHPLQYVFHSLIYAFVHIDTIKLFLISHTMRVLINGQQKLFNYTIVVVALVFLMLVVLTALLLMLPCGCFLLCFFFACKR